MPFLSWFFFEVLNKYLYITCTVLYTYNKYTIYIDIWISNYRCRNAEQQKQPFHYPDFMNWSRPSDVYLIRYVP